MLFSNIGKQVNIDLSSKAQFLNLYVLYTDKMNFACVVCWYSYPQLDVMFSVKCKLLNSTMGLLFFSNGKQVDQEPTHCRWMTLLMDGVMEGRNFWSEFYFALFVNNDFTAQALHIFIFHFSQKDEILRSFSRDTKCLCKNMSCRFIYFVNNEIISESRT